MKRPGKSTILLIAKGRVARADFAGGTPACQAALRPSGATSVEAVRAAMALGSSATGSVWVLSDDVWAQNVALNPAQVAGLPPEQLARALSFEVEPFSGIPASESVTGFQSTGPGTFAVVEMARMERDAIQRLISTAGGKLAGITRADAPPADDESLPDWFGEWLPRLEAGAVPVITPPGRAPSPQRFLVTGVALGVAALGVLFVVAFWNGLQRSDLDRRAAELAAASRELDSANKQIVALKLEQAALEKQKAGRAQVFARRGALRALLDALAALRGEEVLVQSIKAEGPSSVVVNGLALEAVAVDELGIVLTQKLKPAGWSAQARSKVGKKHLPSGGPWEFALLLTHEEAGLAPQPAPGGGE